MLNQLEMERVRKNFSLKQETHPERLWVIGQMGDIDLLKEKKILDLGCGGHKTINYTDSCIGIDVNPNCGADIVHSIDTLKEFEDNSVDFIISRHSLEHLIDPVKALKEWHRVLKLGGKMIIVLPDYEAIDTMSDVLSCGEHLHAYTRDSFLNLLFSVFTGICIDKFTTVIDGWSFGFVVTKTSNHKFDIEDAFNSIFEKEVGEKDNFIDRILNFIRKLC